MPFTNNTLFLAAGASLREFIQSGGDTIEAVVYLIQLYSNSSSIPFVGLRKVIDILFETIQAFLLLCKSIVLNKSKPIALVKYLLGYLSLTNLLISDQML